MALELVPDLRPPMSIPTYARMRSDPQLAAIVKAYGYPIRRASWGLDGSDCRPEVTQLCADELGLPILGQDEIPSGRKRRRFQWAEHLRMSLLSLTFGHMAFERIYDTTGPLTRIAGVYERMPQTIRQVDVDRSDGQITEVKQNYTPNDARGIMRNALVWYCHEREGANWYGTSLLRPAWSFWLLKHEAARVHAISLRRYGTGILEVTAPQGATPGQVAEAQRYASQIRVSETGGAGLPYGFTSQLRGMIGSVPDAVAFMNYLDHQMTRSTLTSLLDLGDTTHGSRALGETFMDLFILALQSIADEIAEQATDQLVVPLVDLNWGEDEPAPRIVCGDVGAQHEVTAQTMQLLLTSGAISSDPALEEYLRREYKLPDRAIPWVAPGSADTPALETATNLPEAPSTAPDQGNTAQEGA
jgi:hypothetical protein